MKHRTYRQTVTGSGSSVPLSNTANDIVDRQPQEPVSISASNKCYVVSISMPAAKKENIVVYVEDHVATVVLFKENNIVDRELGSSADELNIIFRKKISLPADADADFIHAEYDNGILQLFISKCSKPSNVRFHPVAVY